MGGKDVETIKRDKHYSFYCIDKIFRSRTHSEVWFEFIRIISDLVL